MLHIVVINRKELIMSEREQAKMIIDSLPEYKLEKLLVFLRGVAFDDEIEDDMFCEKMYQYYLNSPEGEKNDFVTFEELLKECGVSRDEL